LRAAVVGIVAAGEENLTLRFQKKALAVVAFARAKGRMVY
jgi:hypothetical protein